jgi:hypothetical protein
VPRYSPCRSGLGGASTGSRLPNGRCRTAVRPPGDREQNRENGGPDKQGKSGADDHQRQDPTAPTASAASRARSAVRGQEASASAASPSRTCRSRLLEVCAVYGK